MTDINVGAITEAINNKADRDADNLTATGKHNVNTLSCPSDRYTDLTLLASGSNYTAPANGYFSCARTATAAGQMLQIEGNGFGFEIWSVGPQRYSITIPVRKGQVIYLYYSMPTANHFRFFYAKGEENV